MIVHTPETADRLRELSVNLGPMKGPLTVEQLRYRIQVLQEPHWLEFLGISEDEAQASLNNYRRQLYAQTRGPETWK